MPAEEFRVYPFREHHQEALDEIRTAVSEQGRTIIPMDVEEIGHGAGVIAYHKKTNRPAGAMLAIPTQSNRRVLELFAVVHPDFQGQRLSEKLGKEIQASFPSLKQKGFRALILSAAIGNKSAERFASATGMTRISKEGSEDEKQGNRVYILDL